MDNRSASSYWRNWIYHQAVALRLVLRLQQRAQRMRLVSLSIHRYWVKHLLRRVNNLCSTRRFNLNKRSICFKQHLIHLLWSAQPPHYSANNSSNNNKLVHRSFVRNRKSFQSEMCLSLFRISLEFVRSSPVSLLRPMVIFSILNNRRRRFKPWHKRLFLNQIRFFNELF